MKRLEGVDGAASTESNELSKQTGTGFQLLLHPLIDGDVNLGRLNLINLLEVRLSVGDVVHTRCLWQI